MYIAQALLHGYSITGNQTYLEAATRSWNYVATNLRHSNGLIGERRTEVAQFGLVSKMLYDQTANSTYLTYANEQKTALLSVQTGDGGFLNSDFTKETWACKFAIDFDLKIRNQSEINTPHLVYVTSRVAKVDQLFANECLRISATTLSPTAITYQVDTEDKGKPVNIEINGSTTMEGVNWAFANDTGLLTIFGTISSDTFETAINWTENSSAIQPTPIPDSPVQPSPPSPSPTLPPDNQGDSNKMPASEGSPLIYLIIFVIAIYFLAPAFVILIYDRNKNEKPENPT